MVEIHRCPHCRAEDKPKCVEVSSMLTLLDETKMRLEDSRDEIDTAIRVCENTIRKLSDYQKKEEDQ